jgi:SET domain-containing protein
MKKKIINSIIEDCNVRLKPSKVCSGVGVFSIKPIKSGVVVFRDVVPDNTYINFNELNGVGDDVLNYLKNMCNCNDNGLYLSRTVNNINISYFINHSDNPNVEHDLTLDVYRTIRDIDIDEELLCFYNKDEIDFSEAASF